MIPKKTLKSLRGSVEKTGSGDFAEERKIAKKALANRFAEDLSGANHFKTKKISETAGPVNPDTTYQGDR